MAKDKVLYFNEGVASVEDSFFLGGLFYEFEETETEVTRVVGYEPGEWFWPGDVEGIVSSLVKFYINGQPALMALTRTGGCTLFVGDDMDESQVPIDPGYLFSAVLVGDSIVACGSQNQMWRWNNGAWSRLGTGAGVNDQSGAVNALYSVSGTGMDALYAVGNAGNIVVFDGTAWSEISSPTNVPLNRVLSLGGGEIYIAGRMGQAFHSVSQGEWHPLVMEGLKDNFWNIRRFKGEVYLSTATALFRVAGSELERVDVGDSGPTDFARLFANDSYMWATTGTDQVFRFDGGDWVELVFPDNA